MAEENDWDSSKNTESDLQPSTSNWNFDQKTPHSQKHDILPDSDKKSRLSEMGDIWVPPKFRRTPLPHLPWANKSEVWQTMVYKEEATSRNRHCRLFEDSTSFLPRMRSILVDWIMEVCEAYRLQRITFYLALDYIDRYLTITPAVPKSQLQLIGIASLFIAAKLEEVYPPRLSEFAYVCDGAYCEKIIITCEIVLLGALGWDLNVMTPTGWLNVYMQIHSVCDRNDREELDTEKNFFYPQYSSYQFVWTSHLMDLFTLDPEYFLFSYSVIAASAMFFSFGKKVALKVSGMQWDDLKDCVEHMTVYYIVLRDADDPRLRSVFSQTAENGLDESVNISISKLANIENHTMQTHVVNTNYFEKAIMLRLRRMGLNVEKVYEPINSVKPEDEYEYEGDVTGSESQDSSNEDETKKKEENKSEVSSCEGGNPALLMFKIEKQSDQFTKGWNDNDINFFTSKNIYSFDEILVGIHQYTSKKLLAQSSFQNACSSDNLN
ncbi:hypothetical protein FQR65_LT14823 [Abscondita terminalis]|nr:hypothetical protein FQR65_LT14823 [Abscondita terminalis]